MLYHPGKTIIVANTRRGFIELKIVSKNTQKWSMSTKSIGYLIGTIN